jgi:hypothetical protein
MGSINYHNVSPAMSRILVPSGTVMNVSNKLPDLGHQNSSMSLLITLQHQISDHPQPSGHINSES